MHIHPHPHTHIQILYYTHTNRKCSHTLTYSVLLIYSIFDINIKNCFLNHHMNIIYTKKYLFYLLLCCATMSIPSVSYHWVVSYAFSLEKYQIFFFFTHYIGLQCLFLVFASGPGSSETSLRGIGKSPSMHKAERLDNERLYYTYTALSSTASCSNKVHLNGLRYASYIPIVLQFKIYASPH